MIQGKLILCTKREIERLRVTLEKENSNKPMEIKEEKAISINSIMMLLYSKNRQYEVKNLTLKEEGKRVEVEVNYFGHINQLRDTFKEILAFQGFDKVIRYHEDDSGLKKLRFSFNLTK